MLLWLGFIVIVIMAILRERKEKKTFMATILFGCLAWLIVFSIPQILLWNNAKHNVTVVSEEKLYPMDKKERLPEGTYVKIASAGRGTDVYCQTANGLVDFGKRGAVIESTEGPKAKTVDETFANPILNTLFMERLTATETLVSNHVILYVPKGSVYYEK